MNETKRLAIEQAVLARIYLRGPMTKKDLLASLGCKRPEKHVDNTLRRLQRAGAIRFHDGKWVNAMKRCPRCKGLGEVES